MSQRRPRSTLCPPGGAASLPPARHSPTGCPNLQQHEHTHSLFESASLYALLWNRFRSFDGLLHDLWDRHVNDLSRAENARPPVLSPNACKRLENARPPVLSPNACKRQAQRFPPGPAALAHPRSRHPPLRKHLDHVNDLFLDLRHRTRRTCQTPHAGTSTLLFLMHSSGLQFNKARLPAER